MAFTMIASSQAATPSLLFAGHETFCQQRQSARSLTSLYKKMPLRSTENIVNWIELFQCIELQIQLDYLQ